MCDVGKFIECDRNRSGSNRDISAGSAAILKVLIKQALFSNIRPVQVLILELAD
jgi:hypothetical protein